jgi:hypothetical protein
LLSSPIKQKGLLWAVIKRQFFQARGKIQEPVKRKQDKDKQNEDEDVNKEGGEYVKQCKRMRNT